ncbi:uncharacterized protein BO88DRAFT_51856 [Aspergillus vadensis CBS 113365]|uniref:Uncharacterized protein n=1 Tax=Aspergillus vadensis (strain CBS 113365 / IMI 142717 / IBT 24658) TaxID=1448311 RepID=A0A319B8Y0_ASPVC|nr:hypothetical protein BO88DRAFT_51856 [Aspergillus vadensis CBS 113365]PYH68809.1 hypothetical protein BO88DRAFT_51856 [Aspergillus vadensis CBS 113365]
MGSEWMLCRLMFSRQRPKINLKGLEIAKKMNPAMLRFGRPVLQPWNDLSGSGNWNDFFIFFYVLAFSHAMAGLHVVGGVSYLFDYV